MPKGSKPHIPRHHDLLDFDDSFSLKQNPFAEYLNSQSYGTSVQKIQSSDPNWQNRFVDCWQCPMPSIPLKNGVTILHKYRQAIVVYRQKVEFICYEMPECGVNTLGSGDHEAVKENLPL